MIKRTVDTNNDNSRIDKYVRRLLPGMPTGLMYKQFRNKNITLNGKKIKGSETVSAGDEVTFYLAEDTFNSFNNGEATVAGVHKDTVKTNTAGIYEEALAAYRNLTLPFTPVYENDHIIIMNKPAGMLTQRSKPDDISLNEYMLGYLIDTGAIDKASLLHFKPSVLNRLDRNTSGIVLGSKSLKAAGVISKALKERTLHKLYRALVWGEYTGGNKALTAYLKKDSLTNAVSILDSLPSDASVKGYDIIKTGITLMDTRALGSDKLSALDIELITGRTHQIRAHLAALGHPIIGDPKYGDNTRDNRLNIHRQLLHAYKIEFDETVAAMLSLDSLCYTTDIPFALSDLG